MTDFSLPQLKSVLRNTYAIASLAIGGIVASPLSALIFDVGPPWPAGVVYMTALANLVTVIIVFQGQRIGSRSLRQTGRIAQWVLLPAFIAYMMVHSLLVEGQAPNKFVKGFVSVPMTVGTTSVESGGVPENPKPAWEPWSIATARLTLLLTWFLLCGSFSVVVSVFVLGGMPRKRRRRKKRATSGPNGSRGSTPSPVPTVDDRRHR